jgi:glycosyltransferase involved in cell wall biosynthesis
MAVRLAFLNTHPIQYFAPLYAYLNRAEELSVSAVYLADYSIRGAHDRAFGRTVEWDVDLLGGYDAQFVAGAGSRGEPAGFFSMIVPQVARHLTAQRFDALVVHGHTPAALLIGAAAAKMAGTAVFMRGETHLGLQRSPLKSALRTPLMGALYRMLDGVLAIGTANAAFYRAMGVPQNRISLVPYTVDNDRFRSQSALSAAERAAARADLGVTDARPIVLYAAKFQPRKRPADLLKAAALLEGEGLSFKLVMAGSGELEEDLRALAASLGLKNVSFPGFVNQSALPGLYAACDVFVLPSENEPWGLAVNEAMCAGLPVVASEEIGCVDDLVRDGVNGHIFQAGDIEALAGALQPLLRSADLRARMGVASKDIINGWSYAECLSGIRAALSGAGLLRQAAAGAGF